MKSPLLPCKLPIICGMYDTYIITDIAVATHPRVCMRFSLVCARSSSTFSTLRPFLRGWFAGMKGLIAGRNKGLRMLAWVAVAPVSDSLVLSYREDCVCGMQRMCDACWRGSPLESGLCVSLPGSTTCHQCPGIEPIPSFKGIMPTRGTPTSGNRTRRQAAMVPAETRTMMTRPSSTR